MRNRVGTARWLLLMALLPFSAQAQVIGVLEDPQCSENHRRVVRPLFVTNAGAWRPIRETDWATTLPVQWMVPGASPAQAIRVSPPNPSIRSSSNKQRDFVLSPIDVTLLPASTKAYGHYRGWCDAPKNSPLVVVSGTHPVRRLAAQADRPVSSLSIEKAFLRSMPNQKICRGDDSFRAAVFRRDDLVVDQALIMPGGKRLVSVSLRSAFSACGSEAGGVSMPRWFVRDRTPRFIGDSLTYVASVDADGDGKPEHLFWFSGYNEDGYLLFNSEFDPPTRFTWKYH